VILTRGQHLASKRTVVLKVEGRGQNIEDCRSLMFVGQSIYESHSLVSVTALCTMRLLTTYEPTYGDWDRVRMVTSHRSDIER